MKQQLIEWMSKEKIRIERLKKKCDMQDLYGYCQFEGQLFFLDKVIEYVKGMEEKQ